VDINIDFNASIIQEGNGRFRLKPTLTAGVVSTNTTGIKSQVLDSMTSQPVLFTSYDVVISDGEQSGISPLIASATPASTRKRISGSGASQLKPEEEKMPTFGLLAGTTSVYCAQFVLAVLPAGQIVLDAAEIKSVEMVAEVVAVA
jgi:hypothetical protein